MAGTRTRVPAISKRMQWSVRSLEGDLGAFTLELGLGGLGLLLVDTLEDRLGGALDGVLGLLEAQAGQLTHDLDDLDLLAAVALEHDVERVLLRLGLGRRATSGATGGRDGDGGGRGDLEGLLELLHELGE